MKKKYFNRFSLIFSHIIIKYFCESAIVWQISVSNMPKQQLFAGNKNKMVVFVCKHLQFTSVSCTFVMWCASFVFKQKKNKSENKHFFSSLFQAFFFFCSTFKCDINAKVFCLWVFFCFLVSFLSRYLECQCNRTANENLTKKIKLKFVQFFNFLSVIFCLFVSSICFCQFLCTILKFFSSFRIFFNCRSLVIWCVWHLLDIRSLVIWISAFRSYFVKRWFPFCFGTSV